MKKFFATVFVLAAIAGAALFLGWAQRGVPPGSYGVLSTRSHGVDPGLVVPGEFRWVWHKLIPTNSRVLVFRLGPVRREFRESGELPSARTYSAFLGAQEDFSWDISASVSFRLRPSALVPLVRDMGLATQEDLARHEGDLADEIMAAVVGWARRGDGFAWEADALMRGGEAHGLSREIERRFPSVSDFSLRVSSARLPDFAMYERARALHGEFLAQRLAEGLAGGGAGDRLASAARIAELEMLGELLTRFPVLLEYLALDRGGRE